MQSDDSIDWQAIRPLCEEAARRHDVVPDLHPLDFIFRFVYEHPGFDDDGARINYYFDDGAESARKLAELISETCSLNSLSLRLLEFASGYGCVTRHLTAAVPGASVTSCDIHREAVEFIEERIGVPSILSDAVPERLVLTPKYDVIFALSFFSHMPKTSWSRWLDTLGAGLRPGGCLIFTTHGIRSGELFMGSPQLDSDGFWFQPASEQRDLETSDYGTTLTSPSFVHRSIDETRSLRLVLSTEAFWWTHQDLYVVRSAGA
jgi:SAM-dependent methyltransferase